MDATETVAAYGAAWNEPDDAARAALLASAWSDDGTYEDPTGRADGRAALVAHLGGFHVMMPGHTIVQTTGVDVYGCLFRFGWAMRHETDVAVEGMDFGEFADDGRIRRITGFFGPFPELAT